MELTHKNKAINVTEYFSHDVIKNTLTLESYYYEDIGRILALPIPSELKSKICLMRIRSHVLFIQYDLREFKMPRCTYSALKSMERTQRLFLFSKPLIFCVVRKPTFLYHSTISLRTCNNCFLRKNLESSVTDKHCLFFCSKCYMYKRNLKYLDWDSRGMDFIQRTVWNILNFIQQHDSQNTDTQLQQFLSWPPKNFV